MINLSIKFIIATTILSILGFSSWLIYEPWLRLLDFFETESKHPETFFEEQTCILGQTRMKGSVNVGILEQKLYLSHTSPLNYFIHPLLIDLEAISKIEPCFEVLLNESYKFFIGNPHITTLVLAQDLVEKLEQEYGEPIFSNKLSELS